MSKSTDTNDAPKDTELIAKNREADMAEAELRTRRAEQAIAEAEKAKFTAGLPASSTKPLDGKIDLDDKAGYFSEILAFESAGDGAKKIANQISTNLGTTQNIYLVKQLDYIKGALQLKEIEQRLQTFDEIFVALDSRYKVESGTIVTAEAASLLALAAIPTAIGALADIAAMFRVDRSIKGHTTTVNDEALMTEVARALREPVNGQKPTIQIYLPSLNTTPNPIILEKLATTRKKSDQAALRLADIRTALATVDVKIETIIGKIGDIQKKLDNIMTDTAADRKEAKDEIKRLKVLFEGVPADKGEERKRLNDAIGEQNKDLARLQADEESKQAPLLEKLAEFNDSLEAPKNQKAQGEVAASQFETVIKAFADFATKLVSVPDGGTSSPLTSLAETCILRDLPANSLILVVAVAGQGGEVETRKSIWTSGAIYHRAGTACTYTLFSNNGKIVDSGLAAC